MTTKYDLDAENIFRIPEENLELAQAKIAKLNKSATKLGCTPVTITILDREEQEVKANQLDPFDSRTYTRFYYIIEVFGTAPVLDGWSFVAKLDHEYSTPIITSLTDVTVPTIYRNHDASCDHCKSNRARKITYVVQNVDTLEYKHVGKSCLKDFLGHISPTAALRYFEYLSSIGDELEELRDSGGRGVERYGVREVLATAKLISDVYGYVSAKKAREEFNDLGEPKYDATNWDVSNYYFNTIFKREFVADYGHVTEEHLEFADEVIEFFKGKDANSDYMYNLHSLIAERYIKTKEFAIVVSMVGVYLNHIAKAKEEAETNKLNEWFGEAKKRQEAIVKVIHIRSYESQFGVGYVIKMVDDEGRTVVWFASSKTLDEGDTYKVKLTVKDHDEYKGWKQTIVNRVTVLEVLEGESE